MSRADLDLKLAAAAAVVGLVTVSAVDVVAVRALPALALVLIAPGYALSVALLPGPRDRFERSLLAVGLSLCVDVVAIVILDRTPWGLTSRTEVIFLGLFTLAACWIAFRRRGAGLWLAPGTRTRPFAPSPRRLLPAVFLAALAVLTVVASVVVARLPAGSAHVRGYTVLWGVHARPTDTSYSVGVRSAERRTVGFRLLGISGGRIVMQRRLVLRPGQEWTARARLGAPPLGGTGGLQILLYRDGQPGNPYRRVNFGGPA